MNKLQKIIMISLFGLILGGFAMPLFIPKNTLAVVELESGGGGGGSSSSSNSGGSGSSSNSSGGSTTNPDKETGPSTSILPSNWKIENILNTVLVILTTGIGIAASISIVVAGVMYSAAGGSAQQVQKAKTMILNTIIGLIAYSLLWAFAQWLIPGGVF